MMEIIDTGTDTGTSHQIEVRLTGQVTKDDYDNVLVPAIESALKDHDGLRLLFLMGADFTGYDMGAMWADSKFGLTYWSGFERIAVATDTAWVSVAMRAFAPLMPCPLKVFPLAETDDARRWLRESLGAVHVVDLGGPVVQIQLMGRPDADDFTQSRGRSGCPPARTRRLPAVAGPARI